MSWFPARWSVVPLAAVGLAFLGLAACEEQVPADGTGGMGGTPPPAVEHAPAPPATGGAPEGALDRPPGSVQ